MRSVYTGIVLRILAAVVLAWTGGSGIAFSQGSMNVVLRGNWDNNSLPTVSGYQYNDVWGYEAAGREYGFIGSTVGVHVIDVTNPTTPVHIAQLNSGCASSIWRDFATYQNYLYVVSDNCAGSTLQIFDLSPLPGVPTMVYNSNAFFTTAHTVFINPESRRLYVGGANTQMNGVIILDLTNPIAPTQAASFFLGAYTHDVYVHHDTLYAFFGTSGMGSFDLVNLMYPYPMGYIYSYPEYGYAHSGYGIKNNKKIVWADETADKGLHVGNIEDPNNITWEINFRSALLSPTHTNSMAHNMVAVGDYLYVSYYQDGLQIWNMGNPLSPVRVGYYDTNVNGSYTGMFGAWGIHPPLPSGNILVSDTQNGLFVLQFNNIFPATMVDFAADALQGRVHVHWATESETSCKSFTVERSRDGKTFEEVTEVEAAGNSSGRLEYGTFDESPYEGRSFYRIRQNDFDGNTSYSEIKEVDLGKGMFDFIAYPNPAARGDRISLNIESLVAATASLDVVDMVGRKLVSEQVELLPGVARLELPSMDWAMGSYLLRLTAGEVHLEKKLMIAD